MAMYEIVGRSMQIIAKIYIYMTSLFVSFGNKVVEAGSTARCIRVSHSQIVPQSAKSVAVDFGMLVMINCSRSTL